LSRGSALFLSLSLSLSLISLSFPVRKKIKRKR